MEEGLEEGRYVTGQKEADGGWTYGELCSVI